MSSPLRLSGFRWRAAIFDRTKDWADLEAIAQATPEDIEEAAATIAELVGKEDPAVQRLEALYRS
jgi:hypothetical protein